MNIVRQIGIQVLEQLHELHKSGYVHGYVGEKYINLIFHNEMDTRNVQVELKPSLGHDGYNVLSYHSAYNNYNIDSRFLGRNAHNRRGNDYRDDFQSLNYLPIYLVKGELPWSEMSRNIMDSWTFWIIVNQILKIKEETKQILCDGLPMALKEFHKCFTPMRNFYRVPKMDYDYFINWFTRELNHALKTRSGIICFHFPRVLSIMIVSYVCQI